MVERRVARILRGFLACALTLALGACSGGDDDDDAAPATSAAPGPATTVRPVDTSFTGQNSGQFCTLARTYNDRFTRVSANPTPAELRIVANEGDAAITAAVSAAPGEIKPDVEVIARAFGGLLDELERVNFEIDRLPAAAFSSLSTPEFQTSTTRFQAYMRTVCGVTTPGG